MDIDDAVLQDMRAWLADCIWQDIEPDEIDGLNVEAVLSGIDRHFDGTGGGGVGRFLETYR